MADGTGAGKLPHVIGFSSRSSSGLEGSLRSGIGGAEFAGISHIAAGHARRDQNQGMCIRKKLSPGEANSRAFGTGPKAGKSAGGIIGRRDECPHSESQTAGSERKARTSGIGVKGVGEDPSCQTRGGGQERGASKHE